MEKIRIILKNKVVFFHLHRTNCFFSAFYVREFSSGVLHGSMMGVSLLPGIHLSCFPQFPLAIASFFLGQHEITPASSQFLHPSSMSEFQVVFLLEYLKLQTLKQQKWSLQKQTELWTYVGFQKQKATSEFFRKSDILILQAESHL